MNPNPFDIWARKCLFNESFAKTLRFLSITRNVLAHFQTDTRKYKQRRQQVLFARILGKDTEIHYSLITYFQHFIHRQGF